MSLGRGYPFVIVGMLGKPVGYLPTIGSFLP
jgi:hypothetical protein